MRTLTKTFHSFIFPKSKVSLSCLVSSGYSYCTLISWLWMCAHRNSRLHQTKRHALDIVTCVTCTRTHGLFDQLLLLTWHHLSYLENITVASTLVPRLSELHECREPYGRGYRQQSLFPSALACFPRARININFNTNIPNCCSVRVPMWPAECFRVHSAIKAS